MSILLIVLTAALVGLDQLVKYWAINSLEPIGTKEFIHIGSFKILDLTYLENDGAIFGSMAGQRWFLIGFTTLVIVIGFVGMFWALKRSKFLSICIMLFVSGGIGNLIDRVRFGYVVDFFEVKLFHFAIFNVADICVTCAFVLMLVYILFIEPKIEKAKKAETVEEGSSDE